MSRIAYVNGRYVPHAEAAVHIEDRGYQFADGVYEVVAIADGQFVDEDGHLDRLDRSLRELQIAAPMSRGALRQVLREVVRRNRLDNGIVYMQVTRGVAPRDHKFPKDVKPAVVIYPRRKSIRGVLKSAETGVTAITQPDLRWKRCDIKTVSLLPNCLAKQAAAEAGAYEAILHEPDGTVTEGTSSNAWIVTHDDRLITRAPTNDILNGITRQTLIRLARQNGYGFEERSFTLDELFAAREAFVSSATSFVMPLIAVDGRKIGDGRPGPLSKALLQDYAGYAMTPPEGQRTTPARAAAE